MRYLITFILSLTALTAFSQGAVDRIELGYQTTRRGIVWVRPGLPTHEPAWRISRDTNSIMWHNLTTGIRYDWSYDAGVWYTRDFIASTLPPLDVFTSGAATIDNTQATWINDDGVLHHYSQAEGAWLPDKISFQSAGPTDIAAGVSNGAAVYTTSLWQDSDTYLVYYWDGDSWELLSGSGTNLTYSGTSSPVTLNSSTGTDVTVTAGTGLSLSATSTNMTITNSAPDQTVSITGAGINVVTGTYPTFTITGTEVDGSVTNEGVLGVGAGGASSSTIISNTSGATGVTINAAGILTISESTSSNGGSITITGTEVDGSVTNEAQTLSVSGTTSGILTLSTAGGAGGGTATIASGTNIGISQSGGIITITNTGAGALSGVANQVSYFNTPTTITTEVGSGANSLTWDDTNNRLGIGTTSPSSILDVTIPVSTQGIVANYTYAVGMSQRPLRVVNQDGLETFAIGASRTNNEGNIFINAPTGQGNGAGITFTANNGATPVNGIFQLDNSGNMVFRQGSAGSSLYYDFGSGVYFRNSSLTSVNHINSSGHLSIAAGNTHPRALYVNGEVRIADVITDAPTTLIGVDADGDVGSFSLSGLSISGGTLIATDGSTTNELQTISVSGTTTGIITLSNSGGTATIAAGTGITVGQSGGTITITNSSPATAGWLLDGNTIGAAKRIGSNDNFDVVVETNGTDRMWFDNGGAVSIGTTQSTAAQLVIKGLLSSNGVLIDAGGTLTGPTFYAATGSGSGSNATVLSGVVNMLNGNVEALIQNTATTGTGGALLTLNTHQSATGDPKVVYTTNGTTTWAEGIDNSISGEPWKLTANSDIGAATPAISATTANKVGVNQAAASVTLQVTGTDAVGLPSGTIAQRSAAAIPQIRHNNTFSGFEFYDPNKNYWYRLTGVSSPSVATSAAAGTGATAGLVSGAGSNDVRGAIELTTGSASLAVGTVVNVTYSNPYSGTATNVILTPKNDAATTESNKWCVTNETQNGFSIRAVTALTASTTYQFNYSIGQ